jgi:hypothetical protein
MCKIYHEEALTSKYYCINICGRQSVITDINYIGYMHFLDD